MSHLQRTPGEQILQAWRQLRHAQASLEHARRQLDRHRELLIGQAPGKRHPAPAPRPDK